jgi:hypothetical protein
MFARNLVAALCFISENCRPPSNVPGFAVAGKLRQLIHQYGNITVFKAYMEYNSENVHPRAMALQSELQSSGISMTNCPHNGRKDVADKMILGEHDQRGYIHIAALNCCGLQSTC